MNIIQDLPTFNGLVSKASRLIDINLTIPSRVFIDKSWCCAFCSFDLCFSPDLLQSCVRACDVGGDKNLWFMMLSPDPVEYYYKEFRRFGAVSIATEDDIDRAWSIFEDDPGNSPADALMFAVTRFAVFAQSLQWAVWGSRDDDVIICGAKDMTFLQALSRGRCDAVGVDDALNTFLMENENPQLMRENYGLKYCNKKV